MIVHHYTSDTYRMFIIFEKKNISVSVLILLNLQTFWIYIFLDYENVLSVDCTSEIIQIKVISNRYTVNCVI